MRITWRAIAVTFICGLALPNVLVADDSEHSAPDIDMFASMTGKCPVLKIADRGFACTSVAFFHSPGGRSSFTVPLNDPDDDSHIITFSGDKAKRDADVYELTVDRMLLKSKDRPKLDGLPVPSVVLASGACKQVGNFATQKVSSVACSATDANNAKYEFQFDSDGTPIRVMMVRAADPEADERRAKALASHIEQIKCRQKADTEGVLPRDRTDFILKCMDE
jgi:hypothetical protein